MDEGTNVCHGYLKKSPPENKLMRMWHKRFFVLKSNQKLIYFKHEKDRKPVKEPINLKGCRSVEASLNHKNFKYVFSINTIKRTYYLVAESQKDMDNWVENLCRVCGFERQDDRTSPELLRNKLISKSPGRSHSIQAGAATSTLGRSPSLSSPNMHATYSTTCPLSMPALNSWKERTHSDPPDCQETIKRAEMKYIERRKSTPGLPRDHMTLPVRPTYNPNGLSRVSECYDPVPSPTTSSISERKSFYDDLPPPKTALEDVDGGYAQLTESPAKTPLGNYDIVLPRSSPERISAKTDYDTVPLPRPASQNMNYDIVPSPSAAENDTDLEHENYKIPQRPPHNHYRNSPVSADIGDREVYDIVPPPRPKKGTATGRDMYDVVPPPQPDDIVPPRRPVSDEVYDIVPPGRPVSDEVYDIVPLRRPISDEIYDIPPKTSEINYGNHAPYDLLLPSTPPRPSKSQGYDQVPPPRPSPSPDSAYHDQEQMNSSFTSQCSLRDEFDNRDSGSYPDDIYDVPPPSLAGDDIYDFPPKTGEDIYDIPPTADEDIYDIPPKANDADVYDVLPTGNDCDIYDFPPFGAYHEDNASDGSDPPVVDRSRKPPPLVNRGSKPATLSHDYSNIAPPVSRKLKPISNNSPSVHSYENIYPAAKRQIMMTKSQSMPESFDVPHSNTHSEQQQPTSDTDYCDMQPSRTESTRCYSFTREHKTLNSVSEDCYENMQPVTPKRESGVHSNSSSSEDGDDDNYMPMDQDVVARGNRRAALQYCEVQIVEGSPHRAQIPLSQRNASSQYTTINEESTKALLETRKECLR